MGSSEKTWVFANLADQSAEEPRANLHCTRCGTRRVLDQHEIESRAVFDRICREFVDIHRNCLEVTNG